MRIGMKQQLVKYTFGFGMVLALLTAASLANGQNRREVRGRKMTKAQVKLIVDRVETRVDHFVKDFDASLDRSKLDGSGREDGLNARARDLEHATDAMRADFDRRSVWFDSREEVRRSINIASDIDRTMRQYSFGTVTEANWNAVRYDLNSLADVYSLPRVGANAYR